MREEQEPRATSSGDVLMSDPIRQHDNAVNCVKRHYNEQSREAKRRKVQDKEPRQQLDAWHNEGGHNEEMGDDLLKILAMIHSGLPSFIEC